MDFEADIFSEEDFSEYSIYLDEVNFPIPPRDYVPVSSCVLKNVPEPPEPHPLIGGARFPYFDLLLTEIISEGCSICTTANNENKAVLCDTERVIPKEESASEINNEDVIFIESQPSQKIQAKKTPDKKTRETLHTDRSMGAKVKSESYHKSKERKRKRVSTGSSYVSDTEEFDYSEELKQYRQHQKKVQMKGQNEETELESFSAMKIKDEPPPADDQISKEKNPAKTVQKEVEVIDSQPLPSKSSTLKKNSKGSSQGAVEEEEVKATCALPPKSYSSRQELSSAKRYHIKKESKRYYSSSEEEYEEYESPYHHRSRPYSVYTESDYGNYDDDDEVFYCEYCHKSMNSRKTWECHIVGKKHLKAKKMANPEQMASDAVPMLSADISKRLLVKGPPPGYRRITRNQPSKIQRIVDEVTQVCPGFEMVVELIGPQTDYCYYCEMCDAICMANSIISHVASYKHKLNYLKHCDPKMYDSVHMKKKLKVEKELNHYFTRKASFEGWGKIRVQEDVPIRNYNPDMPGPSSAFSGSPITNFSSSDTKPNSEIIEIDPETSKGDYFCRVCNSHMNSHNMWISHVNGKRHIKNVKKAPGELPSKVKFVKSDETAWLLDEINKSEEVIAGLSYISEKRLETGSATYACYLCHSNCTAGDIIEHLKTLKHMMKFLEKEHAKKASDLKTLTMHMSPFSMKSLYTEACSSVIAEKGPGEIEVLIPKS